MAKSSQRSPDAAPWPNPPDRASRVISTLREEFAGLHPRLLLARLLCAILPNMVGNRLRAYFLRAVGFQIGHGCMMYAMPRIAGDGPIQQRLKIGQHCQFNVGCLFDLADSITIGDGVGVGHEVLFLTASHVIGSRDRRAGAINHCANHHWRWRLDRLTLRDLARCDGRCGFGSQRGFNRLERCTPSDPNQRHENGLAGSLGLITYWPFADLR